MVVRFARFSFGAILQLSHVAGGCIYWLDLNPGPWPWELHTTGGVVASAYGSHGVAPPPQVKRRFCFLVGHLASFGTLRFGLPTMGCILRDREEEKLSFAALLFGILCNLCGPCLQGGLGAELWVQDLR